MADKQICQIVFLLEIFQKIDNLCLNGDIQCGNRLIADDKVRIQGNRPCNTDPLPLSAGKFMRIAVLLVIKQAAAFHNPGYIGIQLVVRNQMVFPYRLADDLTDRKPGRKTGIGILENNLNFWTEFTQFVA